jgi:hypothetical protein
MDGRLHRLLGVSAGTGRARRATLARCPYSAVVGSITALTCAMLFAGKPAVSAWIRIRSALGAR